MHWALTVLLSFGVVLVALFLKFVVDVKKTIHKFAHIPQADPDRKEHFLFGLANEELNTPDPSEVFTRWCLKQVSPVSQTRVLSNMFVWNSSVPLLKQITGKGGIDNYKEGNMFRRADYGAITDVFGKNIVEAMGEPWRWRKQLLVPYFQTSQLATLIPEIQNQSNALKEILRSELKGKSFDLDFYFILLTIEVISYHIWGRQTSLSGPVLQVYLKHLIQEGENISNNSFNSLLWIIYEVKKKLNLDSDHKQFIVTKDELRELVLKEIQISKELMNESIISGMIRSGKYTDTDLISEVLVLLFAGHDTTAHTMSFMVHCLVCNPSKLEMLMSEIDGIFAEKGDDDWTMDMLNRLPYLTACMHETLRLFPIAWASSVVATKDAMVGEFFIPKGVEVVNNFRAMGMDPNVFKNPDQFVPERHMKGHELYDDVPVAFQFNMGAHSCLGKNLAYMELRLILSELLRSFTFAIAPEHRQLKLQVLLTLRSLTGIMVTATPRNIAC